MADNNRASSANEAVCIDAGRIYDSCCDRDCLEDLKCYFTTNANELIDNAVSVRARSAKVVKVYIDVEPVSFNRGYYSCDLTFFFVIDFDVLTAPHSCPKTVKGTAYYSKKVILFGSEGNVRVFSNDVTLEDESDDQLRRTTNMPRCVVQTVDPICLSARIGDPCDCSECRVIPSCVCDEIGGQVTPVSQSSKSVYVTLGLFSTVQLIRNVQMLIPVYDFCIPEKQCTDTSDQPCDAFRRIKFPIDDFFPPSADNDSCGCKNEV